MNDVGILILEDNLRWNRELEETLKVITDRIYIATNVNDAHDILQSKGDEIVVIISGVRLVESVPDRQGMDFIVSLAKQKYPHIISVVILSATKSIDLIREFYRISSDTVYPKSYIDKYRYERDDFRNKIKEVISETLKKRHPGVPHTRKEYLIPSFRSVFISYGGPDQEFAENIETALSAHGVNTFLFSKHSVPGEKLHRVMREGVNKYDRVVLICSKQSLDRPGVLNEIEETLQREAREGGESILIPITVDKYVFADWAPQRPDIARAIRDRVVADFSKARHNNYAFNQCMERLIEALKKSY